jgi:hypothetical protein
MKRRLGYAEAATELRIKEKWLRDNIRKLPHSKLGRFVYFTDADLERIDELFHYEPTSGPLASPVPIQTKRTGEHPLAALKPLPARRRAS